MNKVPGRFAQEGLDELAELRVKYSYDKVKGERSREVELTERIDLRPEEEEQQKEEVSELADLATQSGQAVSDEMGQSVTTSRKQLHRVKRRAPSSTC
jgi:hypothetical protein